MCQGFANTLWSKSPCVATLLSCTSALAVFLRSEVWGLPTQQRGGLCQQRPQLQREARRECVHGAGGGQSLRACPIHGDGAGATWSPHLGDHRKAGPRWTSSSSTTHKGTVDSHGYKLHTRCFNICLTRFLFKMYHHLRDVWEICGILWSKSLQRQLITMFFQPW